MRFWSNGFMNIYIDIAKSVRMNSIDLGSICSQMPQIIFVLIILLVLHYDIYEYISIIIFYDNSKWKKRALQRSKHTLYLLLCSFAFLFDLLSFLSSKLANNYLLWFIVICGQCTHQTNHRRIEFVSISLSSSYYVSSNEIFQLIAQQHQRISLIFVIKVIGSTFYALTTIDCYFIVSPVAWKSRNICTI